MSGTTVGNCGVANLFHHGAGALVLLAAGVVIDGVRLIG
jgi:hypothetical protein